jgi:septum formation protein
VSDVDETVRAGETPDAYVRRVAEEKARAVAEKAPARIVLAADTVVIVEGEMLGKPRDAADASRMLRALSGRAHEVLTAVTLIVPDKDGSPAGARTGVAEKPSSSPDERCRNCGT